MKLFPAFSSASAITLATLALLPSAAHADPVPCQHFTQTAGPDGILGTDDDTLPRTSCGANTTPTPGATVVGSTISTAGGTAIGQGVIIESSLPGSDSDIFNRRPLPDASVAVGYAARVDGDRNVVVGANSRIGGIFAEFRSEEDSVAVGSTVVVLGTNSTAVGSGASIQADNAVAIGASSQVRSDATGAVAMGWRVGVSGEGAIAIGRSAQVNNGINILPVPDEIGGVAVGDRSRVQGRNNVAYGGYAVVGTRGDVAIDFTEVDDGTAIGAGTLVSANGSTALGARATVASGATNSVAIGAAATASGTSSSAFGADARATGNNSVAIGQGSLADQDNIVSVGRAGAERRITNVAAGVDDTDAVNMSQLNAAVGGAASSAAAAQATATTALASAATAQTTANTALANAATAQGTADTALANAATAQTTADTAIVRGDRQGVSTATALGGGSAYNSSTGAVSAPVYAIGGQSFNNVGSAFDAVDGRLRQIDSRLDILSGSIDRRFRQADGGIAMALALGGTTIVPDSNVSVSFNLATYRGEQGFSGAVVVRAAPRVYLNGGFAGSTVKGSTGGRVGVAFGF